jgi:hypothetical protein
MKSNEALRGEAEKAQAEAARAAPLARSVALAASKGYAFTADEAKSISRRGPRPLARNSPMPNS